MESIGNVGKYVIHYLLLIMCIKTNGETISQTFLKRNFKRERTKRKWVWRRQKKNIVLSLKKMHFKYSV